MSGKVKSDKTLANARAHKDTHTHTHTQVPAYIKSKQDKNSRFNGLPKTKRTKTVGQQV